MKHVYHVPDMSCGHCKARIEKALAASGLASSWSVELEGQRVSVESESPYADVAAVLDRAGYRPADVAGA